MCFLGCWCVRRPIHLKQIGNAGKRRPVKTLASQVPVFGARFQSTTDDLADQLGDREWTKERLDSQERTTGISAGEL